MFTYRHYTCYSTTHTHSCYNSTLESLNILKINNICKQINDLRSLETLGDDDYWTTKKKTIIYNMKRKEKKKKEI